MNGSDHHPFRCGSARNRSAGLRLLSVVFCAILVAFVPLETESLGSRSPVKAAHGMVVSAESLASTAGVEVLKSGGNAVDAAVAVGFALAVTFPEAGNLGGGGFMVIRLANGTATMIDFREKAPLTASRDMFLDSAGNVIPNKSLLGPLASGVPGAVGGLLMALEKYGTKGRSEILQHAIDLAEKGFVVDKRLAASLLEWMNDFHLFPSSIRTFTRNGAPCREGDTLVQTDLAGTLKAVRDRGADGFYRGKVAELIVAEMNRSGGKISEADLAAYAAVERMPVRGSYRGYDIISSALPSAGGTVLLEILNILERFDLRSKGPNSSATIHLIASAAQRAYADRATFMGDPDFVSVPVSLLTSKSYGMMRSLDIDVSAATPSLRIRAGAPDDIDHHETTHYCVADRFGNVVSTTVTLNDSYGCKTVVDGAGFFLNNEMDDFVAKPGEPNIYGLVGGDANAIAPGKRMLSSMTPTIVLKDGGPSMVLGARGGGRITTTVAQIIVNVIDFGMNIQQAVDAPRIHHQWLPDTLFVEADGVPPAVLEDLRRMGYAIEELKEPWGRAEAMLIENNFLFGGPDPREGGVAVGY